MKIDRQKVYDKFGGKCAYSGTPLESDWQIDHVIPKRSDGTDSIDNLMPCQKIINHYKRALPIDNCYDPKWNFRHRINNLHNKLKRLPKNPRVESSINKKAYLLQVALYFGITPDKPFNGKFYFEALTI
jgi:CRISPR/Cas system Type II protein with McrA/HNH and RuvC-like nuclease domain